MPLYIHGPFDEDQWKRSRLPDVQHSRLIYQDLEDELDDFCRTVPPVAAHLNVYSTKLWGILLRASAEIDSQLHALVVELEGKKLDTKIADYKHREKSFQLAKFSLLVRFDGRSISPFSAFSLKKSPSWWKDYNAVKHRRLSSLENATLGNAIEAVGAAYIVLYRQWGEYLMPRQLTLVNGQHVAQSPSNFFSLASTPW